jgi:DNA repair exonuclease SbcCD ATPase subunit
MACLQFLSGSRDQELQELSESYALTLGSGAGGQIIVRDQGVAEQHCQVYLAQGSWWLRNLDADTVLGKARVKPGDTRPLPDRTVFIVGSTYVKFWATRPPAGGAGPSGSGSVADAGALEQVKRELGEAKSELERLRGQGSAVDGTRRELETARKELDAAKRDADEQRRAAESAQGEARELEGKLAELRKQLSAESKVREEAEGKQHQAEAELTRARAEAEAKVAASAKQAKEEVEQAKRAADARVEEAKREAEAELRRAKAKLAAEQEELQSALAADRAVCEALRGREEALGRDRLAALRQGSDLQRALEALELPEALRRRLEAAVQTEVDREALRRTQGPVVPLRGLRVPGLERDLESELRAARRQSEQADLARKLGLQELAPAELDELLEAARA